MKYRRHFLIVKMVQECFRRESNLSCGEENKKEKGITEVILQARAYFAFQVIPKLIADDIAVFALYLSIHQYCINPY